MSNVAGKAYAMNVITPSSRRRTWLNRLVFMVGRARPATLGGLMGLSLIHFARWVIIKPEQWPNMGQGRQRLSKDYMLFCSNFNGTWDQYIDAFSDGIPNGLNLFWITAEQYPGSIPIAAFKRYITWNQIQTDYYYNATPGHAQRDVKAAMRVGKAVRALAKVHASGDVAAFAKAWRAAMRDVQGSFVEPGFAPVASLDTEHADVNRIPFLRPTDPREKDGGPEHAEL